MAMVGTWPVVRTDSICGFARGHGVVRSGVFASLGCVVSGGGGCSGNFGLA